MKISQLGEKRLIERIFKKRDPILKESDPDIISSFHDDAALQLNNSKYTVLSTDMLIEDKHFPQGMTFYQMGQKIVTVNVSDILSMNAKPESILVSMALPPNLEVNDFDKLVDGIIDKCIEYDVTLIGGDINENNKIILSATATGLIDKNITLQSNIKDGDLIATTGLLGTPAAAMDLIENPKTSLDSSSKEAIIKTLLEPDLPLEACKIFRENPELVTSMTDITDGLAVELGHLHDKNQGLGFYIYEYKLPYNKDIEIVASENNKQLNEYLLHFGEEFELLLTLNQEYYRKYAKKLDNVYIIGKVNKTNEIKLVSKNNTFKEIKIKGYEHLKE